MSQFFLWIVALQDKDMGFNLNKIAPWGRSFDEYVAMFALSEGDLGKSILGCADGPASFNAELTRRDGKVLSLDPLYKFSSEEIKGRIDETFHEIMSQTHEHAHEFVWERIPYVEKLGRVRMEAMEDFLSDYSRGLKEHRYIAAGLPKLPFEDGEFELALCSHFLFLYSEQLSLEFHVQSIKELVRVAGEARIFPLLELGTKKSRHLEVAIHKLEAEEMQIDIETVPYEFQIGGNQMLRIK